MEFSSFFRGTEASVCAVPSQHGLAEYFRPTLGCSASTDCPPDVKKRSFPISHFPFSVFRCLFAVFPFVLAFSFLNSSYSFIFLSIHSLTILLIARTHHTWQYASAGAPPAAYFELPHTRALNLDSRPAYAAMYAESLRCKAARARIRLEYCGLPTTFTSTHTNAFPPTTYANHPIHAHSNPGSDPPMPHHAWNRCVVRQRGERSG